MDAIDWTDARAAHTAYNQALGAGDGAWDYLPPYMQHVWKSVADAMRAHFETRRETDGKVGGIRLERGR